MKSTVRSVILGLGALIAPSFALADVSCGSGNGEQATGAPIKIGGIHGNAAPGDFSAATDAATAYFKCVNANGGVHGRPIEYTVENDQWNPELAAQAASKLVEDQGVIAMVSNGSFVEMSVNASLYARENIMSMAAACAVSECFESSNIVSTNQGPLPSSIGAAMYAVEELGATSISCIGLAIPSVGNWSCGAVEEYMASKGLSGSSVLLNPASPDVNSALLEAIASGADSMLVNLPAGLGIAMLSAAEEQDLSDVYSWTSSTPIYDASVPDALGSYWNGKLFVSAELTELDGQGPDNQNWLAVMDTYANADDPRDTFAQSGYLAAQYFTKMLAGMDPGQIDDRAAVTKAIKAISDIRLIWLVVLTMSVKRNGTCQNHAGIIVSVVDGGFKTVRGCFEYEGPYFAELLETEKALGLR